MLAVLKIVDYSAKKAVVVPVNIVQRAGQTSYVMVAVKENGKYVARRVNVAVGQTYAGQTEITKGLQPGDHIITTGYQDLNDGDEIKA